MAPWSAGMDPTREQWGLIADAVIERGHDVTFDCAYQGFATGDVDGDSYPIRLFVEKGINFQLIQSYAKVGG
jgi:aspartate aminotransferase, cytoplasmic